jgi:hypothetical protein
MASKLIIKGVSDQLPEAPEMDMALTPPLPAEEPKQEILKEPPMQVSLLMRKGLDGRLIVYEHDHIDIVYLPEKNKVVAFAKQDYSDIIYETQNRLFDYLIKKGMCAPESVQGGNVYGSIEGKMLKSKDDLPVEHLFVLNLKKWIDSEKPALEMDKQYNEKYTDMMTEPDMEDSTELGEVPQEEEKGSIPKYAHRRFVGGWR